MLHMYLTLKQIPYHPSLSQFATTYLPYVVFVYVAVPSFISEFSYNVF